MNSVDAKQFLIARVLAEAELEQIRLSDIERKMLSFTEVHAPSPDIYEINAEFERDYNSDEYETKIIGLLKRARDRDENESATKAQQWDDALEALQQEDHYILVMTGQAFSSNRRPSGTSRRIRDILIYVVAGIALVVMIFLYAVHH